MKLSILVGLAFASAVAAFLLFWPGPQHPVPKDLNRVPGSPPQRRGTFQQVRISEKPNGRVDPGPGLPNKKQPPDKAMVRMQRELDLVVAAMRSETVIERISDDMIRLMNIFRHYSDWPDLVWLKALSGNAFPLVMLAASASGPYSRDPAIKQLDGESAYALYLGLRVAGAPRQSLYTSDYWRRLLGYSELGRVFRKLPGLRWSRLKVLPTYNGAVLGALPPQYVEPLVDVICKSSTARIRGQRVTASLLSLLAGAALAKRNRSDLLKFGVRETNPSVIQSLAGVLANHPDDLLQLYESLPERPASGVRIPDNGNPRTLVLEALFQNGRERVERLVWQRLRWTGRNQVVAPVRLLNLVTRPTDSNRRAAEELMDREIKLGQAERAKAFLILYTRLSTGPKAVLWRLTSHSSPKLRAVFPFHLEKLLGPDARAHLERVLTQEKNAVVRQAIRESLWRLSSNSFR